MDKITVTKFNVAERQLLQAISLYFREEDDISIHTLSEAAGQVLHDIGKDNGVISLQRNTASINPEFIKIWFKEYLFKSRNFFKHGDHDKDSILEFNTILNDTSLFDSINMHHTLKKQYTPETYIFLLWFSKKYPNLLLENTDWYKFIHRCINEDLLTSLESKKSTYKFIRDIRAGIHKFDFITLEYGLP